MGMGAPPTARMRSNGVPVAVGADSVASASGDQFDEARTGLFAERMAAAEGVLQGGAPVGDIGQLGMTAREALESITINAARACWLEDRVGSLTPGKAADVILLDASHLNLAPLSDAIGAVVGSAHGADVDTVLVGGEVVKRDGRLVIDVDRQAVAADLRACRDRLYAFEYSEGLVPQPVPVET